MVVYLTSFETSSSSIIITGVYQLMNNVLITLKQKRSFSETPKTNCSLSQTSQNM